MDKDHGWRGRGKARIARYDGEIIIRSHGVTTRGGRAQAPILTLLRKDYRSLRPSYEPFAVRLWIESPAPHRFDLDNVAKACLDALNSTVWHDDKQVRRLTVEKLEAETAAVTLAVAPYGQGAAEGARDGLSALLARVEALDAALP